MATTTPTFFTGNVKPDAVPPLLSKLTAKNGPSRFDSKKYSEQKYNEIKHDVDIYLDNSGNFDIPRRYHINPAAILGLYISDTVNDWVADGYITFMYLPEGVEDLQKIETGQTADTATTGQVKAAAQNGDVLRSYVFRGDGYDLLRVMIMPKSTGDGEKDINITQNDTKWMLSYLFSIYDVEDVNDVPQLQGTASSYMKCLKLKFHDVRYQMLETSNLEYSSAEPKDTNLFKANFQSEMAPGQGVMHTGDILKDLLNYALTDPRLGGCEEFKIQDESWDKGKAELFYTSPAQWSALDDVNYIFSHHISEAELGGESDETKSNDMCMLHTDRSKTFPYLEEIKLTPLSDFFKKAGGKKGSSDAGELQKEHFFITSASQEVNVTHLHRAPMGGDGKNSDVKTARYGQIMSYSFVDMSATINSNMFCSTPVYSVDIAERQFNMEFKGNDVISARRLIAKSYISELFNEGDNPEDLFLPTIHKNKKDVNIFPTFSLNGNNPAIRQRNGIHHLLYTGVFQNACICFKVYGLTFRESGTFIGIDKTEGCADNDYNNKLYGQWFVVKVEHIFEAGAYVNIIYAVKIHRHKPMKAKFEETIKPK